MKDDDNKDKSLSNDTLDRRADATAAVLCCASPVRENALVRVPAKRKGVDADAVGMPWSGGSRRRRTVKLQWECAILTLCNSYFLHLSRTKFSTKIVAAIALTNI